MLNLYYRPTCPFCQRVLMANAKIGAPLTLLDVGADDALQLELIAKGGKKQVPFLEDTQREVSMYESADIITYLATHYGDGSVSDLASTPKVRPID